MTRKIFMRDGSTKPHEIIICDGEEGEIMVISLTDYELLDLATNIDCHTRAAWQRIKRNKPNT